MGFLFKEWVVSTNKFTSVVKPQKYGIVSEYLKSVLELNLPQTRGKKSRRAADDNDEDAEDDDDKEEMSGRSAKASARRREQARVAHILGHSAAARNLPLAVSLACETRMTRREAVAVLKGQART